MATVSSFQAAEEFLVAYEGNAELVTVARRKALDLRAQAGEATLKLSARAADSADSVLKAAGLLQNLAESLFQVQDDLRDAKQQLGSLLAQVDSSSGILDKGIAAKKEDLNPPLKRAASMKRDVKIDRVTQFFESKLNLSKRRLAAASSISSKSLASVVAVCDALKTELDECRRESLEKGWIGRYPAWSSRIMKWFVEKHFYPEILLAAWAGASGTKGEMLTEDQWRRLGQGLKEVIARLDSYVYLFMSHAEGILQMLTASLLQRARQDLVSPPNSDFNDSNHPLRRALSRLMPCLSAHKAVAESIGPIVLIRFSIFLQEIDQSRAGEVRLAVNGKLVDAGLCLY